MWGKFIVLVMWLVGNIIRSIALLFKLFKISVCFIGRIMGQCMSLFGPPKKKRKYYDHDLESNEPDTIYGSPQKRQSTKKKTKGKHISDVDMVHHVQTSDDEHGLKSSKRDTRHSGPQTHQSTKNVTQPRPIDSSKYSSSQQSEKDISDEEMALYVQNLHYHKANIKNPVKNQPLSSQDKKLRENVSRIPNNSRDDTKFPGSSNYSPSKIRNSKTQEFLFGNAHKEKRNNIQQGYHVYQNTSAKCSEDVPKANIIRYKTIDGNTESKHPLKASQEYLPNLQSDNNISPHTDRSTHISKSTKGNFLETTFFGDSIETTILPHHSQFGKSVEKNNNNFPRKPNMDFTSSQIENNSLFNQSIKTDHHQRHISSENRSNTTDTLSEISVNATLLKISNTEYIANSKPVKQSTKRYVDSNILKAPFTKVVKETIQHESVKMNTCEQLQGVNNKQSYGDIRQVSNSVIQHSNPNIDEKLTDNALNETPACGKAIMGKTSHVIQYIPPAKEICSPLETERKNNIDFTKHSHKGTNHSPNSKSKLASSYSEVDASTQGISFDKRLTVHSNNKKISRNINLLEINCSSYFNTGTVSTQRQNPDLKIESRTSKNVKTYSGLKQEDINSFEHSLYKSQNDYESIMAATSSSSQQNIQHNYSSSNDNPDQKSISTSNSHSNSNIISQPKILLDDEKKLASERSNPILPENHMLLKQHVSKVNTYHLLKNETLKQEFEEPINDNSEEEQREFNNNATNTNLTECVKDKSVPALYRKEKILDSSYSIKNQSSLFNKIEDKSNAKDMSIPLENKVDKSRMDLVTPDNTKIADPIKIVTNSLNSIESAMQDVLLAMSKSPTENICSNKSEEYQETNVITANKATHLLQVIDIQLNSSSNESIEKKVFSELTDTFLHESGSPVQEDKEIFSTYSNHEIEPDIQIQEESKNTNEVEYINYKIESDVKIEEESKYKNMGKKNEENIDKKTAVLELLNNNNCSQSHDQLNEQNNFESISSSMSNLESWKEIRKNSETEIRIRLDNSVEYDNGEDKLREITNITAENNPDDTLQDQYQQQNENVRNFAYNIDNNPKTTIENIANKPFEFLDTVLSTVSDNNKSNTEMQDISLLSNRKESVSVNIKEKSKQILDQETETLTDTTTCTQSCNQSQQNDNFNLISPDKENLDGNIENKQLQSIESKDKLGKQMKPDHTEKIYLSQGVTENKTYEKMGFDNLKQENKKDNEETHTQTMTTDSSNFDKKSYVDRDNNTPLEQNTNHYGTELLEEKNKQILDQETKTLTDPTACIQSCNQSQQNNKFNSIYLYKENLDGNIGNKQLQSTERKDIVVKQKKLTDKIYLGQTITEEITYEKMEIDDLKHEELHENKKDDKETHTQTMTIDSLSFDEKSYVDTDNNRPLEQNTNHYGMKLFEDNLIEATKKINIQQRIQEEILPSKVIEKEISGKLHEHLEQNTMMDDVDPKIYESAIKLLETVLQKAIPFEDEIKNFTELEDSNKYYYIEESLRRLIDKLDDMFDDIGENRDLREKRKKVYKYIFPLFDRLDDKVVENKERIEQEKYNRGNMGNT